MRSVFLQRLRRIERSTYGRSSRHASFTDASRKAAACGPIQAALAHPMFCARTLFRRGQLERIHRAVDFAPDHVNADASRSLRTWLGCLERSDEARKLEPIAGISGLERSHLHAKQRRCCSYDAVSMAQSLEVAAATHSPWLNL